MSKTPETTLRITRSEEHTSELQSRTVISYAVFCLKKKNDDMQIKLVAGKLRVVLGRLAFFGSHGDVECAVRRPVCRSDADLPGCFFNDTATPEIYTTVHTLSLHDALPISVARAARAVRADPGRHPGPRDGPGQ